MGALREIGALRGKLVGTAASCLKALARKAADLGCRQIVFNFDLNLAVTEIGIATLMQVLDEYRQANLNVAYSERSINLRTVFEMLGVTRYVYICVTADEANRLAFSTTG